MRAYQPCLDALADSDPLLLRNGGMDADDGLTFAILYRGTQRIQKAEEA